MEREISFPQQTGVITPGKGVIAILTGSTGYRCSETVNNTTLPNRYVLEVSFDYLKLEHPDKYSFIVESGLVIDIGAGDSMPKESFFTKHPIKIYVAIDLNYSEPIDITDIGGCTRIKKKGDFFSVLEAFPEASIPCIFVNGLDSYIFGEEVSRLNTLLQRKLHRNGAILVGDYSLIGGNDVIHRRSANF